MKTKLIILILFLLIANQFFAQVPLPRNVPSAGDLNAERITSYTVTGADLDRFEITSGTKFNNQFIPALWGHHASDNRNSLQLMGTTLRNMDNGSTPVIRFLAAVSPGLINAPTDGDFPWGNDQTLQTINTRPTFSWSNGFNTVMLLSAQNNLGVGTENPTARLHINGSVRFQDIQNSTNPSFMLGTDTDGNVKEYPVPAGGGNDDIDWLTPTGGIPTSIDDNIYTNGKVGIGVNNPLETLHLNGNIRGNQTAGALRINTDSGYLDIGPKSSSFSYFDTDAPAYRFNKDVHILGGVVTSASVGGPSNNKNLKLQTVGTTRIFADYVTGNVGIGTETPIEKLDINGSIRGNQTAGAVRIQTDNGYLDLGAKNTSYTSLNTDRPAFNFNKELQIQGGTITSSAAYLLNFDLNLQTAGTTRILVKGNSGNVGINTSSPSAILHTNGTVRHENLPLKDVDFILGVDTNGNVFRIASGDIENNKLMDLTNKVQKQQLQIEELESQINLLLSNKKNSKYQINKSKILNVSPNPSTNLVDIIMELSDDNQEAKIIVSSVIGKAIKTIPIIDRGSSVKKTIYKGGLSAGTYLITLVVDGKIIDTKKVIFN